MHFTVLTTSAKHYLKAQHQIMIIIQSQQITTALKEHKQITVKLKQFKDVKIKKQK